MKQYILPLFLTSILMVSCNKDKAEPSVSVINGDIEKKMEGWEFGSEVSDTATPNDFAMGFTAEASSSPQYSLKITCSDVKNPTSFGYFVQKLPNANIAKGAKVTLKVKIKTREVLGNGISIGLRGNRNGDNSPVFFKTTEGSITIKGTNEFTEYETVINSYPAQIDNLFIFLVYLPETTGTVYFDDVQLSIK